MTASDTHPTSRPALSAAERLTAGVAIAYAVVFLVMWAPTWFGFGGWLFLYPLFLLAWVPIEILAIVSVVLLVRESVRSARIGRAMPTRSWWLLGTAAALVVGSLPVLWMGTSFFVPVI